MKNDSLCLAPWAHTYISPQGKRRLCCTSRDELSTKYISNQGLTEFWNSEFLRDVRLRMLKGEVLPECITCNQKMIELKTPREVFNTEIFPQLLDNIKTYTDSSGRTSLFPRSYDYRLSNICNFKCRMCSSTYSSSWEQENIKRKLSAQNHDRIENISELKNEFWKAIKNNEIEEIYWAGGEPLLLDFHWEVMDYLVKTGQAKNIRIRYNTNLSLLHYKNYDLIPMLKSFRDISIGASIDGCFEIGEYIRDGLNWSHWENNFNQAIVLNKVFGEFGVYLDITLTLPGLLSIKNLIDFSIKYKVRTLIKMVSSFNSIHAMSPLLVPKAILHPIIDEIIKYAHFKEKNSENMSDFIWFFEELKNKKTIEEENPNWYIDLKFAKKSLELLDQYRNNDQLKRIYSQNLALLNWWESI